MRCRDERFSAHDTGQNEFLQTHTCIHVTARSHISLPTHTHTHFTLHPVDVPFLHHLFLVHLAVTITIWWWQCGAGKRMTHVMFLSIRGPHHSIIVRLSRNALVWYCRKTKTIQEQLEGCVWVWQDMSELFFSSLCTTCTLIFFKSSSSWVIMAYWIQYAWVMSCIGAICRPQKEWVHSAASSCLFVA